MAGIKGVPIAPVNGSSSGAAPADGAQVLAAATPPVDRVPADTLVERESVVHAARAATKRLQTCSWCSFCAPDGVKSHNRYAAYWP